jgi:Tfp pilus assembly protein PilF
MLFLLVLFPVSQVFPVGNAIAADRYHYIPSIGLFLLIGWGIAHYEKNKLFMGLLSLWILGLLFVARERIMIWKNPESLWNATIKQNPEIMFAYKNLAKYLEKKGRIEEAEKVYRNALQQDSLYAVGWNELGVMLKNKGKNEEAYTYFIQSVALDSINKEAWLNIGTFHYRRGETDAARIAYQKSIAVDSNYAEVWNNYANSLSRTGSFNSADVFFQKAIRLNPGYAEAYNNISSIYLNLDQLEKAKNNLEQAIKIKPNFALAYATFGLLHLKQNEPDIAKKYFEQGINLKSASGINYLCLGTYYENIQEYKNSTNNVYFTYYKHIIEKKGENDEIENIEYNNWYIVMRFDKIVGVGFSVRDARHHSEELFEKQFRSPTRPIENNSEGIVEPIENNSDGSLPAAPVSNEPASNEPIINVKNEYELLVKNGTKITIKILKDLLQKLDLKTSGNKDELINRLRNYMM